MAAGVRGDGGGAGLPAAAPRRGAPSMQAAIGHRCAKPDRFAWIWRRARATLEQRLAMVSWSVISFTSARNFLDMVRLVAHVATAAARASALPWCALHRANV